MSPMSAVTHVGNRTIAVGPRGHIAVSDDGGNTWRQSAVPVSSDLVAVSFPSEQHGWAVGHGGVVLHSSDGGETWEKQLDGKQASQLVLDYYSNTGPGAELPDASMFVDREQVLIGFGGT
ncbi:Ycf48-like protein [compost metagenome]